MIGIMMLTSVGWDKCTSQSNNSVVANQQLSSILLGKPKLSLLPEMKTT